MYVVVVLLLLVIIVHKTQGHFTYCLDDPYIHLALVNRLRHGLYGINAGEPASPSSSVLWPLLLLPFAGTALLPWVPLLLNTVCSAATAWLLGSFVDRYFAPGWRARVLGLLLLVATNIFGLTYTGLEHSLEVLLCVAGAFAVLHVLDGERVPWWMVAAVALLPSVRYEGVLVTLAVAVALWAARARRTALVLLPVSLVPAAVFSVFLHRLRLPWFPLSVLVKSSYKFQDQSSLPVRLARLLENVLITTLREPERAPQLLLVVVLCFLAWRGRRTRVRLLVLGGCAAAGAVQVLVGPVGWFFRYEIYCLAFTLLVAIAADTRMASIAGTRFDPEARHGLNARPPLPRGPLGTPLEGTPEMETGARPVPGMLLALVGALAMLYALPQVGIPVAALGIYQQQVQLGRFASRFYTGPVAVNDLGWVAYERQPSQYVLDLVGLGSYEAFQTREAHRTAAWLDAITREHGVGVVMIYPEWFRKGVPASWVPMAKLCAADAEPMLGAAHSRVMFYATPLADRPAVLAALLRFRAGLPKGSTLELQPADQMETCGASLERDQN